MRILYINAAVYDFLTAAIIEGINGLSREMRLELVCTQHANYSGRFQVWSREKARRSRGLFDLVILGTNVGVDAELFRDLDCSNRAICIDGADSPEFAYPPQQFRLYFKRELRVAPSSDILPCPFAVERRWLYPMSRRTKYFLTACFGPSTACRAQLLRFLESLSLPNSCIGPVRQGRLQKLAGVLRGQCTWSTARKYQFAVGHNGEYYKMLRASSLALRRMARARIRHAGGRFSGAVPCSLPPRLGFTCHSLSYRASTIWRTGPSPSWPRNSRGLAQVMPKSRGFGWPAARTCCATTLARKERDMFLKRLCSKMPGRIKRAHKRLRACSSRWHASAQTVALPRGRKLKATATC